MKEKVANAFSRDIQYAMQWVEVPDDATYEAFAAECRYGMLENELNSALRESIKAWSSLIRLPELWVLLPKWANISGTNFPCQL